jgi:hypothetical protein
MLTVFAIDGARPQAKSYKLSDGNGLYDVGTIGSTAL